MRKTFLFLFVTQTLCASSRLFIGPEAYWRDYHEKFRAPLKSDERGMLYGFRVGYDYENAVYLGGDFGIAWGRTLYDGSTISLVSGEVAPSKSRTDNQIFNIEGRGGYCFRLKDFRFTPFIGVGYFQWNRMLDDGEEIYYWNYAALGLRTAYQWTPRFDMGLNLKMMRMLRGEIFIDTNEHFFHLILRLGNRWQTQVEIPLTYRFNCLWDLRAVPFFLYQPIGKSNSGTAIDPDFGLFNINEPSSRTYVFGLRLESGFNF